MLAPGRRIENYQNGNRRPSAGQDPAAREASTQHASNLGFCGSQQFQTSLM